jgi:hypothetical protein
VTDDEFEVRLEALRSALSQVLDLLNGFGDDHWSTWFADVEQRLERHDLYAFDRASMAFGGMGIRRRRMHLPHVLERLPSTDVPDREREP